MSTPRILFATSEVTPIMKTGGLADVSAGLPRALAAAGCDLRLVLPGYGDLLDRVAPGQIIHRTRIGGHEVEILAAAHPELPPLWLVCSKTLFERPGNPYLGPDGHDWPDNADRFALFSRAIVRLALRATGGFRPDLVHLNDWQTGLAAALLASAAKRPKVVFTIHNLHFQGLFPGADFERLGIPPELTGIDALEFHGQLAFIKGGLVYADAITTVSPGYAREIQTAEFGTGLDGLLRHRSGALTGIINGIDTTVWNPASDPDIAAQYDDTHLERKADNKAAVQARVGLPAATAPLLGMVTRLTDQKGIDLVIEALPGLLGLGAQLVILGSGAAHYERALAEAAAAHPSRVAFVRGYDEALAHLIEAGADVFLMPSRFEPCGLNQMYSMIYGTPPVVYRTGGLADTVTQVQLDATGEQLAGTGFIFERAAADALLAAVADALACWRDPPRWRQVQRNGMQQDFSWSVSSRAYLTLYQRLLQPARAEGRSA